VTAATIGSTRADSSSRVDTDALRREHSVAELVARYGIELRRVGAALVGRCPFHQDRGRPNLHVYPSGRWICYRCDQRGDVIAFVQQMENLTFREAAARLDGERAGSTRRIHRVRPVPRLSHTRQREIVLGRDEYRALAAATDLYANQLFTDVLALGYMADRGFPRGLLERYRVGYSRGDELVAYLRWRRLPLGAAVRAGLITADGREFLAGRIVFPELRDGQTLWLIGRVLPTGNGKPSVPGPTYLGLPGYKPLLGWDEAIRDLRGVCVLEGPMDLMALRKWGVPGVALCGTGASPATLELLRRWELLYAVLDNDTAGRDATDRLIGTLGPRVVPVALPQHVNDPAELAPLPDGKALFCAAIRDAVDPSIVCVSPKLPIHQGRPTIVDG
jgi:DNA primase